MRSFCANERCFMSSLEVADDVRAREVEWPDGSSRLYTRGWLVTRDGSQRYPLCSSCADVLRVIQGDGEGWPRSHGLPLAAPLGEQLLPFCANPQCFTHALAVPASHVETVVGLEGGSERSYTRDWLVTHKHGRKYPVCDACGNVAAAIRGDGEGLQPTDGVEVSGELVGPDGETVERVTPETEADIAEPEIQLH